MALEPIGMAQAGEPLEPEDSATALRVLNVMLKALQRKLNIWKRKTLSITLVDTQYIYTIGQKIAGNTTPVIATQLFAPDKNFNTDNIQIGDTVINEDTGATATVTAIINTTNLDLSSGILTPLTEQAYSITSADVSAPRPIKILECNRKRSDGSEVAVNHLTRNEYEALSNKTSPGAPINYHYDPTIDNGTLYIWQAPDANAVTEWTLELVYQATIEDVDLLTDNIDIPAENLEALVENLTYRLSKRLGSLSASDKALLREDARAAIDLAEGYDQETGSVMIYPELRDY